MESERSSENRIPLSAVRRFPRYLTCAQRLRLEGVNWVSSSVLAKSLGLTSSTVRQDLSHVDIQGVSKRGYSVVGLEAVLARTLGVDRDLACVLVGAGNLGRALALHEEFARQGFKIMAVFDSHAAVIGKKLGRFTVQGMAELAGVIRSGNIDIGIISVPHQAAQQVADQLIHGGIRGLLNLTTAHVSVKDPVPVVDARILSSLRELAYAVKSRPAGVGGDAKAGES